MAQHFLFDGPAESSSIIVLAHGAGAAMDSPFMNTIAAGLAGGGYRVARFEFPYMAARREGRRTGAPDRESVLLQTWREVIDELGGGSRLVIGGKSLGGRIASMVAEATGVGGLLCLLSVSCAGEARRCASARAFASDAHAGSAHPG